MYIGLFMCLASAHGNPSILLSCRKFNRRTKFTVARKFGLVTNVTFFFTSETTVFEQTMLFSPHENRPGMLSLWLFMHEKKFVLFWLFFCHQAIAILHKMISLLSELTI